jgi:DNA-binding transcriptional ArsR family regulator
MVMLDLDVIAEPQIAMVALDPVRNRLLAELAEPASAASLATRVGLARQKVNYHLRALEAAQLVEIAEERRWGGLTERRLVATARSFVVSPEALGAIAVDPQRNRDRLAASYLIALGARIVREVGDLWRRSRNADKDLAADRAAFTQELTRTVTELASRYHDAAAAGGRPHRLLIVSHPTPMPGKDT